MRQISPLNLCQHCSAVCTTDCCRRHWAAQSKIFLSREDKLHLCVEICNTISEHYLTGSPMLKKSLMKRTRCHQNLQRLLLHMNRALWRSVRAAGASNNLREWVFLVNIVWRSSMHEFHKFVWTPAYACYGCKLNFGGQKNCLSQARTSHVSSVLRAGMLSCWRVRLPSRHSSCCLVWMFSFRRLRTSQWCWVLSVWPRGMNLQCTTPPQML